MNVSGNDVKVLGKVVSIAVDNIVADAEQVFDKNANLNQETINRNMTNAINQAVADVSSINTRVGSLEDAIDDKLNISDYQTYASLMREDIMIKISEVEEEKQNVLTFDNTPTANSDNPVKSKGVYAAFYTLELQNATGSVSQATELHIALNKNDGSEEDPNTHEIDTLIISQATENKAGLLPAKSEWDNEPTTGSSNLVKSGGIKSAIDNVLNGLKTNLTTEDIKIIYNDQQYANIYGNDDALRFAVSAPDFFISSTSGTTISSNGAISIVSHGEDGVLLNADNGGATISSSATTTIIGDEEIGISSDSAININAGEEININAPSVKVNGKDVSSTINNIFPNSDYIYTGSDRTTTPGLYLYNAGVDRSKFSPMISEEETGLLIVTHESFLDSSTGDSLTDVCQLFIDMLGNRYSRRLRYTGSVDNIDWGNAPEFIQRS